MFDPFIGKWEKFTVDMDKTKWNENIIFVISRKKDFWYINDSWITMKNSPVLKLIIGFLILYEINGLPTRIVRTIYI